MPILRRYNIFISHAWKYGDDYDRLVSILDRTPNFLYYNYSAPKENPLINLDGTSVKNKSDIRAAIDRKISLSSCILVISGMYYNNREWMQYELDSAQEMQKPVIAIKPYGNQFMPSEVQQRANIIVNWNQHSIVHAIREYSI